MRPSGLASGAGRACTCRSRGTATTTIAARLSCRAARGWRKDVVRLTIQLGFQEHFDADADPAGWMSPDYDATEADGWLPLKHSAPVGSHPWLYPEPRGIPLLAQHEHDLTAIVA